MVHLLFVEEGIWVLERNGKNVFLEDCVQFGISKIERRFLFEKLSVVAKLLAKNESLEFLIQEGFLKSLDRQIKVRDYKVWEIRDPGRGGRLIFVMEDPHTIIISAVSKQTGFLSQAIHRGIHRWEEYLKSIKK